MLGCELAEAVCVSFQPVQYAFPTIYLFSRPAVYQCTGCMVAVALNSRAASAACVTVVPKLVADCSRASPELDNE